MATVTRIDGDPRVSEGFSPALPTRLLTSALPALLAGVLASARSAVVPLWRDEYATALHAGLGFRDLLRAVADGDAVVVPYYLLAHLLAPLLGDGIGLRLVSILAFAASAALIAAVALRWWGAVAGTAAGIMFAVNGATITAGMTARPYALMLACVTAAIAAADRAGPRNRGVWAVYSAAALAAVSMHLISAVALACIAVIGVGREPSWWRRWAIWSLPALAAAGALGVIGSGQQSQIAWLTPPDVRSATAGLAQVAGVSAYRAVVWDALGLTVLAIAAIAAWFALARRGQPERVRGLVFAATLTFVAPTALFVASWVFTPVYTARYLTWISIGAALIVGGAVSAALRGRSPWSRVAGLTASALLLAAVAFAATQLVRPPGLYDDFPALGAELAARAEVGDGVVVIQESAHSAVALSLARVLQEDEWASRLRAELVAGTHPRLDQQSIAATDPLTFRGAGESTRPVGTVWIVSLDEPSAGDLRDIDEHWGCRADARSDEPRFFGGVRLYARVCD